MDVTKDLQDYAVNRSLTVEQTIKALIKAASSHIQQIYGRFGDDVLAWNTLQFLKRTKMRCIRQDNKIFFFDSSYWEPIEVPKEYRRQEPFDTSLHYIGPVINGEVQDKFPWFGYPFTLYKTFAGVRGLRVLPTLRMYNCFHVFEGCQDFDAFDSNFLEPYGDGGGSLKSSLYAGLDSPKIIKYTRDDLSFINAIIKHFKLPVDLYPTQDSFSHDFCEALNKLPRDKEYSLCGYTNQGCKIEIRTAHKASDIDTTKTFEVRDHVVLQGYNTWHPIHFEHCSFIIWITTPDFQNDTGEPQFFGISGASITTEKCDPVNLKGDTLFIDTTTCTILSNDDPPIQTNENEITIRSEHGSTLNLYSNHSMQPCIGPRTNTGLSYGRWQPGYPVLRRITLDNVHINCFTKNEAFAIGTYGIDQNVVIECINGATIECPEVHGTRIMKQSGLEGISGSTKRPEPAIYEILR